MSFKILVVDDKINDQDDPIAKLPTRLEATGYEVVSTDDAEAAYDLFWESKPDLVALDIHFPQAEGIDGIDICRAIRDNGSTVPIILITGVMRETEDLLRGFEAGADDYVKLPLDHREILARIRVNLPPEVVVIDDSIQIDFFAHRVWIKPEADWQEVHLQPLEFDLLQLLITNAGLVLTKTVIEDRIWGKEISAKALGVFIHRLRKKLEPDPAHPTYIKTVRNLGYRFNGQPRRRGRSAYNKRGDDDDA